MGNCKDCRNWDRHERTCNVDFAGKYQRIGSTDFAMYVSAADDQGLEAGLKTGPLFGCVQFQTRGNK